MADQFFGKTVEEYILQLKKFNLDLKFVMELKVQGRLLRWPQDIAGNLDNNVIRLYPGHIKLISEGKRIGDYRWAGYLDYHQQTVNHLLLDNLLTKFQMFEQARHSLSCGMGVLNSAIKAIEAKDHYTKGHSDRVSQLAMKISDMFDVDYSEYDIEIASKLHDIGKIGVSEIILCKPGLLTEQEITEIRKHPEIGANILKPLPIFEHLVPVIRHHHEKIDGTGYPDGLAGDDIPLLSRIIAVADTFDALTSNRPYRQAMSTEKALGVIAGVKGSQLDARIVDTFLSLPEHLLTVAN
ncbi:MAG: HD-GYP domain-containing protein [Firmicutes bacterium]|nr:HD-GYP domain-containing protein [Bacillota bacterium]